MTKSLHDEIRALDAGADDGRASDPIAARKKAMDLLARREHAADELVAKLVKSGFDEDNSRAAVSALASEGLQDDVRYVESLVQTRVRQGKGPERIRAELRQRRVADRLGERAIEAADVDWIALAREVRERKFGTGMPADFKDKARQMRFLQYRGFESEHIRSAFREE